VIQSHAKDEGGSLAAMEKQARLDLDQSLDPELDLDLDLDLDPDTQSLTVV